VEGATYTEEVYVSGEQINQVQPKVFQAINVIVQMRHTKDDDPLCRESIVT
jgi:hypothetical protein